MLKSFNNAINGLIYSIAAERNMKIHITAAVGILVLSLFYKISRLEFLLVCVAVAIVIICELFNTALELIVDTFTGKYNRRAKAIKDMSAGAVLIAAFLSIMIAYFVFFDRLSGDLEIGISHLRDSPEHVTFIALSVTIILVLIIKAITKKGSPLSGGMPSGHAAIAFSITTAIALLSENASYTILCLTVTILLVQSRLESKIHNFFEVLAGAFLGFLVTLFLFQTLIR